MFILLVLTGGVSYVVQTPASLRIWPLGVALILAGFALAMTAATIFRREGTEIDPRSLTNRLLIVHGPYRFTRNPMYLSLIVFSAGVALTVGTWPMFVVPLLIFGITNWGHIPMEEAKMQTQHGAAFDAYLGSVRRWM